MLLCILIVSLSYLFAHPSTVISSSSIHQAAKKNPKKVIFNVDQKSYIRSRDNEIYVLESNPLGQGLFGQVKRAYNIKNDQDTLAVKFIKHDLEPDELFKKLMASPTKEARFCDKMGCLAAKYGKTTKGDHVIPMKYLGENIAIMENGIITGVKQKYKGKLTLDDLSEALHRVHEKGLIHGDAHLNNVIYNEKSNRFEMIDFGLAEKMNPKTGFDRFGRSKWSDEATMLLMGGTHVDKLQAYAKAISLLAKHFHEAGRLGLNPSKVHYGEIHGFPQMQWNYNDGLAIRRKAQLKVIIPSILGTLAAGGIATGIAVATRDHTQENNKILA